MTPDEFADQVEAARREMENKKTLCVLCMILACVDELLRRVKGPLSVRLSVFRAFFAGMAEEELDRVRRVWPPPFASDEAEKRTGPRSS